MQEIIYVRGKRYARTKMFNVKGKNRRYMLMGEIGASEPVTPMTKGGKMFSAECNSAGQSNRIYQRSFDREGKEIILMYKGL